MSEKVLYLKDNFFSTGQTPVMNEARELVGTLYLHTMFTSKVTYNPIQSPNVYNGHFTLFSTKWVIEMNEHEIGILRSKISFFNQKYSYEAYNKRSYRIESQVFSREYTIFNDKGDCVASFQKINSWFESSAFKLENYDGELTNAELILAIMGVNQIQKKRRASRSHAVT